MEKVDISFVIPCYCSEKNIKGVISEIKTAMAQRASFTYEIILVDDNSKDRTSEVIHELAEEDGRIMGLSFAKNFGQPSALLAGFRMAQGNYIMTCDDDGQTPIDELWKFYDKMQEGFDIVCAKYSERPQNASVMRKLGTSVNEFVLVHLLGRPQNVGLASVFMAKKFVVEEMIRYTNPYPYIAGLLLRPTSRIGNVTIEQRARHKGQSGYNFKKLFRLWLNGVTAFSIQPLRVASVLGLVSGGMGVLFALFTIIRKLMIPSIQVGYTSQIAILLIIGGIILFVLGIIGEYVGRIYMCINNEPQYVIRNVIRGSQYDTEEQGDKE